MKDLKHYADNIARHLDNISKRARREDAILDAYQRAAPGHYEATKRQLFRERGLEIKGED